MPNPEGFHPDLSKEQRREQHDPQKLHASLSADLGIDVVGLTPLAAEHMGDNTVVFTGQLEGRDVVVKLAAKAEAFHVENSAIQTLRDHAIPTPEVLGFKEQLSTFQEAVIVETKAPGKSMTQLGLENIKPDVIHDAGRVLHAMNQIQLEGFGGLVVRDNKLQGEAPEFQPEAFISDFSFLVTNGYVSEQERAILQRASEEIAAGYTHEPVFVHNDFTEQHIFTNGEHVTGVIDFGGSLSADPRLDIAKTHFHLPRELQPIFDAGYGELTRDPLIKQFELVVAARKIKYRHEAGFVRRIPQAVEVLKRLLEENI